MANWLVEQNTSVKLLFGPTWHFLLTIYGEVRDERWLLFSEKYIQIEICKISELRGSCNLRPVRNTSLLSVRSPNFRTLSCNFYGTKSWRKILWQFRRQFLEIQLVCFPALVPAMTFLSSQLILKLFNCGIVREKYCNKLYNIYKNNSACFLSVFFLSFPDTTFCVLGIGVPPIFLLRSFLDIFFCTNSFTLKSFQLNWELRNDIG